MSAKRQVDIFQQLAKVDFIIFGFMVMVICKK